MKLVIMTIAATLICATPAMAQDAKMPMEHNGRGDMQQMEHKGHGDMQNMEAKEIAPGTEAAGSGVVNSIDTTKKQVNLTHEPIPDLGWPTMTMDLPVTTKVDLSGVKAGDKVSFKLKLGRDKTYRIIELAPAN